MTHVTKDIVYAGVNDHRIDLFEGQYVVPNGMAYNSYVILDDKVAIMDTADRFYTEEWLANVGEALGDREPDYLVVQHMEPDHSSNIKIFMEKYPKAQIVSSDKAFAMMQNYFETDFSDRRIVIAEGDTLELGKHTLHFVAAPMVHWPEVMMTYDDCDKVLFSADGFGKFGALDVDEPWDDEARRYYIGIVGKYGEQVQAVLKKAADLEIEKICSLHGPVLSENLGHYIDLYDKWSSYEPEEPGVLVAYTSVYGHTEEAVLKLVEDIKKNGAPKVAVYDLARSDMAAAVADAFRFNKVVLATTTYNGEIYPFMKEFIDHLVERNFQKKTVALVENGSWAPAAARLMKEQLAGCEKLRFLAPVTIKSAMHAETEAALEKLAAAVCEDFIQQGENADKQNMKALFDITYGLYVVTCNDGKKDNGLIVNTPTQINSDNLISVCINKANYSHDVIKETGKMNVNCLTTEAPFSVFTRFGFQSGRDVDKFDGFPVKYTDNGLPYLPMYINAVICLEVEQYVDMGSHGMFLCRITEARTFSRVESMSYGYYQNNVKPKPATEGKKGWVCKVCGYIYEGEELPPDFICPLCKHPASDFEKLQ